MTGRYVLVALTDEGVELPIYAHDDYGRVKRRLRDVGDGTFAIALNSVQHMRVVDQHPVLPDWRDERRESQMGAGL